MDVHIAGAESAGRRKAARYPAAVLCAGRLRAGSWIRYRRSQAAAESSHTAPVRNMPRLYLFCHFTALSGPCECPLSNLQRISGMISGMYSIV